MPSKLIIENNYCRLTTNPEIQHLLWKSLRFLKKGCYHSAAYRSKRWDGYIEFFKKDTGRFLTGLLPEIASVLKIKNEPFVIQDKRNQFSFKYRPEEIDASFISEIKNREGESFLLRDYQVEYTQLVVRHKRGLVFAPTSSGKTATMMAIIKTLPADTITLVLAHRKSLVDQNYDEISKLGLDVGRVYTGIKDIKPITCATVQSAAYLENILPRVQAIIVDEIHDMMSASSRNLYSKLKNATVRVGLSATPFKDGGSDKEHKYSVKGWMGPVLLVKNSIDGGVLTTKTLQDRNILSSADCKFCTIDKPDLPYEVYIDAVTKGISENTYFHNIIAHMVSLMQGRTLILVERIEHGDRLADMIPNSLWVRGKDTLKTRKEIIKKLSVDQDKVVAIATSGIFNTGINVFLHNLINAAGGKAEHNIIQRFGRGLRVANDKKHLQYYDFLFLINQYLKNHSKSRIEILKKEGHNIEVFSDNEKLFEKIKANQLAG